MDFLLAVYLKPAGKMVREIIKENGWNWKRCAYLLEKWSSKGWYEYGVSVDLGWLETKGKEVAETLLSSRQP